MSTQVRKPRAIKKNKAAVQPARLRVNADQGIYISVPRVKSYLDEYGINADIETAIRELRTAEPHEVLIMDSTTGKPILDPVTGRSSGKTYTTDLITYDKISDTTKALVAQAEALDQKRDEQFSKRDDEKKKRIAADLAAGRISQDELDAKAAADAEKVRQHTEELAIRNAARKAQGKQVRGGPKKTTAYGDKIEFLSLMKTRFAKDAAPFVAAVADSAVQEFAEFGLANTLRDNRKIMKARHLIQSGYEQLQYSCFFRNLSSWKEAGIVEAKRIADSEAKKEATKEAKKEAKKKALAAALAATPAAAAGAISSPPSPVLAPVPETKVEHKEADDEDDGLSFKLYVRHVCYNVINQRVASWTDKKLKNPYEDVMISKEAQDLLNALVIEFVGRLCPLLASQLRACKCKTVDCTVITQVTNVYLETNNIKSDGPNAEFATKINKFSTWTRAESESARAKKVAKVATDAVTAAVAQVTVS